MKHALILLLAFLASNWTHGSGVSISYNITAAPFNATCDGVIATATLSIANGGTTLTSSTPLWSAADDQKYIAVVGANTTFDTTLVAKLTWTGNASQVTLDTPASVALVAQSTTVEWGHSDSPAFAQFNATALTWQAGNPGGTVNLNLPASSRCILATNVLVGSSSSQAFTWGIRNLNVVGGTGTVLSGLHGAGFFNLGTGAGIFFGPDLTKQVRTVTATAGDTHLTISDPSKLSLFNAGDWVMMSGVFTQEGGSGWPPTFQHFEYVQIASISAPDTINLSTPLVDTYKSTWPSYTEEGFGGPATLFAMNQNWNGRHIYTNIIISTGPYGPGAGGRNMSFINCGAEDSWMTPSSNQTWNETNTTTHNSEVEWDKLVTTANITGGSYHSWKFQSSSGPKTLNITGPTTLDGLLNGTPENFNATSLTVLGGVGIGPLANGYASSFNCTNCVLQPYISPAQFADYLSAKYTMSSGVVRVPNYVNITNMTNLGCSSTCVQLTLANTGTIHNTGTSGFTTGKQSSFSCGACGLTFSGGTYPYTLTVVDATHIDLPGVTSTGSYGSGGNLGYDGPVVWINPGATMLISGSNIPAEEIWHVLDVTQDATNIYVTTDQVGGFPTTIPTSGVSGCQASLSGNLCAYLHPAPVFNCSGCTGSADALALAAAPANAPFGSYYKYTLVGATAFPYVNGIVPIFGTMSEVNVTVNTAYTGASSFTFNLGVPGGPHVLDGTTTPALWAPTFDPKTTGLRTITPTTVTPPGGRGTDSVTAPGAGTWLLSGNFVPNFTSVPGDIGSTSVTVEFKTTQ